MRSLLLMIGTAFISACSSVGPGAGGSPAASGTAGTPAPSLGFFSRIKVDGPPAFQLAAQGVQIFRCEKRDSGYAWVFRQPEAQLADATGKTVARHGANFSFENADGSRLVATVAEYDDAPNPADLRWLLMNTRSYGDGAFTGVTQVQRVNTRGGMPPARCEAAQAGQLLRVPFTADFVFYRLKPVAG